jgi:hypothetical protein
MRVGIALLAIMLAALGIRLTEPPPHWDPFFRLAMVSFAVAVFLALNHDKEGKL